MTLSNNSTLQSEQFSLAKRMLAGAIIGLVLISIFLLSAGEGNPAWGKLWRMRPMIMVPFAGAVGGLCSYIILHFHNRVGINKTAAILLSAIVFVVGLFMGIVLGLDGTIWN